MTNEEFHDLHFDADSIDDRLNPLVVLEEEDELERARRRAKLTTPAAKVQV
jgi:hypothetical protein